MSDLLLRIQDAFLTLDPFGLLIGGLVTSLLGLFLWLGGTRFSSMVLGLCGGAMGAVLGVLTSSWFNMHVALSVLIGSFVLGLLAIFLRKLVIVLLAALIFTAVASSTYMSYHYNSDVWQNKLTELRQQAQRLKPDTPLPGEDDDSARNNFLRQMSKELLLKRQQAAPPETHRLGMEKLQTIGAELRYAASENRTALILWGILGGAIGLALGYLVMKLMMALCCSVVGSTAVILGVFAMILAKGNPIISRLMERPRVIPIIFGTMIILGLIVQLLVARPAKKAVVETETQKDV